MAHVSLKNVGKTYPGGVRAVKDFNLEIEDKEFIVLVGPSGCGKSTTLRMIAGLEEITEGEIKIGDRVVNDLDPKDRDIAMVFQNYALYPHMTVEENIGFGLKLRGVKKAEREEKVKNAARILGISDLLGRKPRALSGGQRQRVALGRAIVRNPNVFLMDEPLSNLDAKLRVQTRAEISLLHKQLGATVIYVTHDQTEAMTMGDRLVIMDDGVIQQVDTPRNIYENPVNQFVAGFIGMPQMNFISVKTEEDMDGNLFLNWKNQRIPLHPSLKEHIERFIGTDEVLILGVRPEEIIISEQGRKDAEAVAEGKIDIVEIMGSESIYYISADNEKITARIQGAGDLKTGDKVFFTVNPKRIHLFEGKTGKNLLYTARSESENNDLPDLHT